MQKLVLAVLGAAVVGAISVAGRKFYRLGKKPPSSREDIARWEGEGGSPVPNPTQKA